MIELLFVACVAGQPSSCVERSLLYTDVTPMACVMGAQPELAKWVNDHPNQQIKSWKCRGVNLSEQKA